MRSTPRADASFRTRSVPSASVAVAVFLGLAGLATLVSLMLPPDRTLTLSSGQRHETIPLTDDARYTYSYVNSVYEASVEELHVVKGNALSILGVRSTDLRAVEYFRWDATILRISAGDLRGADPQKPQDEITRSSEEHLRGVQREASAALTLLKQFDWSAPTFRAGDVYVQAAAPNSSPNLTIRVTPRYEQRVAAHGREVDLGATFGEEVVRVAPQEQRWIEDAPRRWVEQLEGAARQ